MGKSVTVTTTIPLETYNQIKARSWAFNELLMLGFEYRMKVFPENKKLNEVLDRLDELEETNLEWKRIAQRKIRELELLKGETNVLEEN